MIVGHIGGASSGGYEIKKSLRFRANASAYLSRTPTVAGNRRTWTWSGWIKRGVLGSSVNYLFSSGPNTSSDRFEFQFINDAIVVGPNISGTWYELTSAAIFRDPSAWYHVVMSMDTTQATATNRLRIFVNGVQQTLSGPQPPQNAQTSINNTVIHAVGTYIPSPAGSYFDGYLSEINFIDGQALDPSYFGQVSAETGSWIPKKYTGAYGTNGFYLPFNDGSNLTNLTADRSGNGNNWTANNISLTSGSSYDWMDDTPTPYADGGNGRGNYAVLSPLAKSSNITVSDGNLYATSSAASYNAVLGTIAPTSGKWYFEMTLNGSVAAPDIGWHQAEYTSAQLTAFSSLTRDGGYCVATDGTGTNTYAFNNGTRTTLANSGWATNDVIGCAIDIDNKKIWFSRNGTWYPASVGGSAGDPASGANPAITYTYSGFLLPRTTAYSGGYSSVVNFGQRPFAYSPPAGFKALCTKNLPTPSILNPKKHFDVVLATGANIKSTVEALYSDQALMVVKDRANANNWQWFNDVTGLSAILQSNTTSAETTYSAPTGSSVGYGWKAGGAPVANTAGSITSQVSANPQAGFSIVTYTGTGANATVGHGLGKAPSLVVYKNRTGVAGNWVVGHVSAGWNNNLLLDSTAAKNTSTGGFNNTPPTTSVFSVGNFQLNGSTYVAYLFAEIAGFSKFGSYTGNGSTDGPFVYCGFRPRFVLVKGSSNASSWQMFDTSRNTYNVVDNTLWADLSSAEGTGTARVDLLSNGFKVRAAAGTDPNVSGATYIYAAFAENPFGGSNVAPAPAR